MFEEVISTWKWAGGENFLNEYLILLNSLKCESDGRNF